MQITRYLFPVALLAAAGFAACGGAKPMTESPPPPPPPAESAPPPAESAPPPESAPPAESAAPAASEAAPSEGPPKPWDDMSTDEKKAYMKHTVVPHMKPLFIAQDAKRYSDFSCQTCHGKAAKQGKFKMPNPKLPKLDFKNKLATEKKKHPEMLEFMAKKVEPEMAKLLGMKPFDPKTKTGFGCGGCHTAKGGMPHHGKK